MVLYIWKLDRKSDQDRPINAQQSKKNSANEEKFVVDRTVIIIDKKAYIFLRKLVKTRFKIRNC